MRTRPFLLTSAVVGALAMPIAAFAADAPAPVFVQPPTTGFDVTIGAGPEITNQFPGSKSVMVLPSIHVGYRKVGEPDPFYTPDDAFDIAIYQSPYLSVGPAANYISNRGISNGNGAFRGLHDIGGTFEVGGFAEVYPIPYHLRLRAEVLQGVTGSRGLIANLGADAIQKMGPFEFSLGPRLGFGNDRFASQYFSVTPAEAAANPTLTNSGIGAYDARGGLTSVGALVTTRYEWSHQWSTLLFGGYSHYVGSVGDSPVTQRLGSQNQFQAGATLNHTFNFAGFGIFGY